MIDPGEAALAVIGIDPVLKKAVQRVTADQRRDIADIGRIIERRAGLLCRGELGGKVEIAAVDYDQMLKNLVEEPSIGDAGDMAAKFPPEEHETAGRFLDVAKRAFDYLRTKFPVSTATGLLGIDNLPPPSVSVTKFEMAYTVVDRPLDVFDLLDTNALLASQVGCLKAVYPTLLAAIIDAVTKRAIYERGKVQSWAPHFGPALSTLLGVPSVPPSTRAALAASNATRQAPGADRQPKGASKSVQMTGTPGRQLEAGTGVLGEDG